MPPAKGAACIYLVDWVSAKLRWSLTSDRAESEALRIAAKGCTDARVTIAPAR